MLLREDGATAASRQRLVRELELRLEVLEDLHRLASARYGERG